MATDRGSSPLRPTAIQARPHAIAAATATRPPSERAASTPTAATTSSTPTASSCATAGPGSAPDATSVAVTFAQVATATQPRYSPNVPSTTTDSTSPPVRGSRCSTSTRRTSTASRATITTTLTQSQPCWVTSSQPALSTIDAAAHHPARRCRGAAACDGTHCSTVYAARPR